MSDSTTTRRPEDLASVALAYRQLGFPVRIVALNPQPQDEQLFGSLLAGAATIQNATLPGERSVEHGPRIPPLLAALTVVVAIASRSTSSGPRA